RRPLGLRDRDHLGVDRGDRSPREPMSEPQTETQSATRSRGQDKRMRATVVLLGALLVEVYWLKFRVVPDFVDLYAELGPVPPATTLVFGWTPYLVALALAPLPLILALRGADGDKRSAIA